MFRRLHLVKRIRMKRTGSWKTRSWRLRQDWSPWEVTETMRFPMLQKCSSSMVETLVATSNKQFFNSYCIVSYLKNTYHLFIYLILLKTDWVVYFCVLFGVILDLRDVMFYNIPRDVIFITSLGMLDFITSLKIS